MSWRLSCVASTSRLPLPSEQTRRALHSFFDFSTTFHNHCHQPQPTPSTPIPPTQAAPPPAEQITVTSTPDAVDSVSQPPLPIPRSLSDPSTIPASTILFQGKSSPEPFLAPSATWVAPFLIPRATSLPPLPHIHNPDLLKAAFGVRDKEPHFQRLALIGDGLVYHYALAGPERTGLWISSSHIARIRSHLVMNSTLAHLTFIYGLHLHNKLSNNTTLADKNSQHFAGSLFEAYIAAAYLDAKHRSPEALMDFDNFMYGLFDYGKWEGHRGHNVKRTVTLGKGFSFAKDFKLDKPGEASSEEKRKPRFSVMRYILQGITARSRYEPEKSVDWAMVKPELFAQYAIYPPPNYSSQSRVSQTKSNSISPPNKPPQQLAVPIAQPRHAPHQPNAKLRKQVATALAKRSRTLIKRPLPHASLTSKVKQSTTTQSLPVTTVPTELSRSSAPNGDPAPSQPAHPFRAMSKADQIQALKEATIRLQMFTKTCGFSVRNLGKNIKVLSADDKIMVARMTEDIALRQKLIRQGAWGLYYDPEGYAIEPPQGSTDYTFGSHIKRTVVVDQPSSSSSSQDPPIETSAHTELTPPTCEDSVSPLKENHASDSSLLEPLNPDSAPVARNEASLDDVGSIRDTVDGPQSLQGESGHSEHLDDGLAHTQAGPLSHEMPDKASSTSEASAFLPYDRHTDISALAGYYDEPIMQNPWDEPESDSAQTIITTQTTQLADPPLAEPTGELPVLAKRETSLIRLLQHLSAYLEWEEARQASLGKDTGVDEADTVGRGSIENKSKKRGRKKGILRERRTRIKKSRLASRLNRAKRIGSRSLSPEVSDMSTRRIFQPREALAFSDFPNSWRITLSMLKRYLVREDLARMSRRELTQKMAQDYPRKKHTEVKYMGKKLFGSFEWKRTRKQVDLPINDLSDKGNSINLMKSVLTERLALPNFRDEVGWRAREEKRFAKMRQEVTTYLFGDIAQLPYHIGAGAYRDRRYLRDDALLDLDDIELANKIRSLFPNASSGTHASRMYLWPRILGWRREHKLSEGRDGEVGLTRGEEDHDEMTVKAMLVDGSTEADTSHGTVAESQSTVLSASYTPPFNSTQTPTGRSADAASDTPQLAQRLSISSSSRDSIPKRSNSAQTPTGQALDAAFNTQQPAPRLSISSTSRDSIPKRSNSAQTPTGQSPDAASNTQQPAHKLTISSTSRDSIPTRRAPLSGAHPDCNPPLATHTRVIPHADGHVESDTPENSPSRSIIAITSHGDSEDVNASQAIISNAASDGDGPVIPDKEAATPCERQPTRRVRIKGDILEYTPKALAAAVLGQTSALSPAVVFKAHKSQKKLAAMRLLSEITRTSTEEVRKRHVEHVDDGVIRPNIITEHELRRAMMSFEPKRIKREGSVFDWRSTDIAKRREIASLWAREFRNADMRLVTIRAGRAVE